MVAFIATPMSMCLNEFNFQGVSDRVYENVEQLKADFPAVSRDLLNTFASFNKLFADLLRILISKGELDKQVDSTEIINLISSGTQDSLEKNFKTGHSENSMTARFTTIRYSSCLLLISVKTN